MVIECIRVSTIDQSLDLQLDALNKFGCEENFKEKVYGAKDNNCLTFIEIL